MRGKGGVVESQPMSIQLYTGAQINFGDLTQYLTYEVKFQKTLCTITDMRVGKIFGNESL